MTDHFHIDKIDRKIYEDWKTKKYRHYNVTKRAPWKSELLLKKRTNTINRTARQKCQRRKTVRQAFFPSEDDDNIDTGVVSNENSWVIVEPLPETSNKDINNFFYNVIMKIKSWFSWGPSLKQLPP